MDLAKTLIRSVVRTFYETKHVLVIDALMVHSALPNEDLALLLGIQPKELRNLCGLLKQDRMMAVHSRQEIREGQQRPINKDYYYVDYHATIDAIKYRVYHLSAKVKEMYKPSEEKKDYFCPRCKAQYTQMEVLNMMSNTGFDCGRCGNTLEREELTDGASTGNEKQTKLASQMEGFLKMLQNIDSEVVPSNDFDTAFSLAVPVQRNEETNPARVTVSLAKPSGPPTAVKGMTQINATPLDVTVTTSSERTATEKAAEAQRKAAIAAQNTLPEWHTKSTVTGQSTIAARKDSELQIKSSISPKGEDEDSKDGTKIDDELTAYYAQMAQEREKEAREEAESDDEEGDFEDVGLAGSGAGTPSSSVSTGSTGRLTGILKRKESESGSSAAITSTSTPAASFTAVGEDEGPAVKKVKFEKQESAVQSRRGSGGQLDKDSDEDDEAEFEDAL